MSRQHGRDGKGRRWRGRPNHGKSRDRGDLKEAEIDLSSPIITTFLDFQKTLDKVHDKHERLVKLSRDITIESKRIIFLLQRVAGNQHQKESILEEAEKKMTELRQTKWQNVAEELHDEDPYQFMRAYSPGLQEYIECVSFHHFLQSQQIVSLAEIRGDLKLKIRQKVNQWEDAESDISSVTPPTATSQDDKVAEFEDATKTVESKTSSAEVKDGSPSKVEIDALAIPVDLTVYVSANDWLLGIADLTGELMRYAITRIGKGDTDSAHKVCNEMRAVHEAFVYFGNSNREIPKKLHALRQSIKKVETACYTLLVRGSEVPEEKLEDVVMSSSYSGFHDMEDDYSGFD